MPERATYETRSESGKPCAAGRSMLRISSPLRKVIDGRPRFAKPSIDDGRKVEIAAIDPDFDRGYSLCP